MEQATVAQRSSWFGSGLFVIASAACCCLAVPPAVAAAEPGPCSANPESRQLDYWIGDWTVTIPGGSGSSASKVYLSLDKCLVVESWDNGKGHNGENMFAYSSDDKSWRGMFADNQGRVHVFVDAKVASGCAEFYGPSRGPNGEDVLNRITVVRITRDRVDQRWEKSTDHGITWTTAYRGEYRRKSS
jgi:hypothetical protein